MRCVSHNTFLEFYSTRKGKSHKSHNRIVDTLQYEKKQIRLQISGNVFYEQYMLLERKRIAKTFMNYMKKQLIQEYTTTIHSVSVTWTEISFFLDILYILSLISLYQDTVGKTNILNIRSV